MKKLKIVFMGTPDFAAATLRSLVENDYDVVGVITAPDRPAGRGQKLKSSAVKQYAELVNLPILQPTNLKDNFFLAELKSLNADLQIIVAFRMLPKAVWAMPKLKTFNLHASLLPEYRGAAPINWAVINGEKKSGNTTFFIDEKIDTGNIILQEEVNIAKKDTAGHLHDRLMEKGAKLVLKTVDLIQSGKITTTLQPAKETKTAYKLTRENTKIDWSKGGETIYNLIRGLSPYPSAWSFLFNKKKQQQIKIHEASFVEMQHSIEVGQLLVEGKELKIAVKNGFIIIKKLQLPGKKVMDSKALLNGYVFDKEAYLS